MPTPEETIDQVAPYFRFQPKPWWDPIWMEYAIDEAVDVATKNQLIALQFEASAAIHRVSADAAEKAAGIVVGQIKNG